MFGQSLILSLGSQEGDEHPRQGLADPLLIVWPTGYVGGNVTGIGDAERN